MKRTSAELSGKWKIPARTLRDIFQRSGVASDGGYDEADAAAAVILHQQEALESYDIEAAKDRQRKNRSEAEASEFDLASKRKDVEKLVDAKIRELFVNLRKYILSFRGATDDVKIALSKHVAASFAKEPE